MLTEEQVINCIKERSVVFATFIFYENYNSNKHSPFVDEVIIKKYIKDDNCEVECKKDGIVYKEIVPLKILFLTDTEAFDVLLGMFGSGGMFC